MATIGNNLPTLNSGGVMEYSTPSTEDRMGEVASAIADAFGDTLPFEKIGALSPTFTQTQANAVLNRNEMNPYANAPLDNYLKNAYDKKQETHTDVSAKTLNEATGKNTNDDDHKIRLTELVPGTNQETYTLFFEVMPEIVESRTVSYEAVAPAQFPGAFQKYKSTDSTQWTVNATLISRTVVEATQNLEYLNRLRSWTMPYFGDVTGNQYPERLGAPPPVLIFSGFRQHMIGPVPVVITSLNWNFPKDVDYIPAISPTTSTSIPFPTVMQLGIQLVESFSTAEFNNFSLNDFRLGNFQAAFSGQNTASATSEPIIDASNNDAQPVSPNSVTTISTAGASSSKSSSVPMELDAILSNAEEITNIVPIVSGLGGRYAGAGASGGF